MSLEYAAAPGCPDAAGFKVVVIARLGHDPFVETAPEHVVVRIESRGRALDGRIEWRDSSGKWTGDQTFPPVITECPRLVRAMGFALAVQIQLLARAHAGANADVVVPVEPASPPKALTDRPIARPPITTSPQVEGTTAPGVADAAHPPMGRLRPVFAAGAGPLVGFGISSAPALLGRVFGALAWQHVSVELAAVVSLPATTRRADGAGFSQQHLLGSAAACATATRWSSCLLANGGEV
ncbi:MAG TPA: hypothetical protein VLV15_16545, partial [Dongiaceae bacterium]|nr:hypothetical protein [Dongiaceae bacterium]